MRNKRRLSILLALSLILGSLPIGNQQTIKASEAEYGLSNPRTDSDGTVTWDCVYFGNYWQNDTNSDGKADKDDEKEPIKWRVLSVDGEDAFLLADQNLDVQYYHNAPQQKVTWETCTMRSWLNSEFFENAFSEAEQDAVQTTTVINEDNAFHTEYGLNIIEGGNDTSDKVYLLSISEAMNPSYGFTSDDNATKTREAANTRYVENGGEIQFDSEVFCYWWWLRSPGATSHDASFVFSGDGNVYQRNYAGTTKDGVAVRPVLHLNLSSSVWSPAGTVSSSGGEKPGPTKKPVPSVYGLNNDPAVASDGTVTWECVWFGNYWQNDTNGDGKANQNDEKEPIKWRVLSVDGDDAFLLADQNLDARYYNDTYARVTWETCTMRSWLNSEFFENAFSETEQDAVQTTTVINEDNPEYETEGGNDTSDKVYLLSISEAMNSSYGFTRDYNVTKTREAANTKYSNTKYVGSNGNWWLRSPGDTSKDASHVTPDGLVRIYQTYVNEPYSVRPALHLNLSSFAWSLAGTVSSSGEENVLPPSSPTGEPAGTSAPPTAEPSSSAGPTSSVSPTGEPAVTSAPPTAEPSSSAGPTSSVSPTVEPAVTSAPPTAEPSSSAEPTSSVSPTGEPAVTSAPPTAAPSSSAEPTSSVSPTGEPAVTSAPPTAAPDSISPNNPDENTEVKAPGKVSNLKGKAKKKAVKLSWKKVSGAVGYEIWVSTSKKFKKKKVKTTKAVKLTVRKLKAKKKYFIKVRAYITKDGKKVYSKWSKVRKIKTK